MGVLNAKSRTHCRVEHRFPRGISGTPVQLASVPGFLLAMETGKHNQKPAMVALNMSVVRFKRDSHNLERPPAVVWRSLEKPVKAWSVVARKHQGGLLAFLSQDGHELEIKDL